METLVKEWGDEKQLKIDMNIYYWKYLVAIWHKIMENFSITAFEIYLTLVFWSSPFSIYLCVFCF